MGVCKLPNLKMYINATPGGTDGTEITALTFKNMRKYMSTQNCNQHIVLPICFRADDGFTENNVTLNSVLSSPEVVFSKAHTEWPTSSDYLSGSKVIGTICQTNVLVFVFINVLETHTSIPLQDLFTISYVEEAV